MDKYKCKRCQKVLKSKAALDYHMKKKIPCELVIENNKKDHKVEEIIDPQRITEVGKKYLCAYCRRVYTFKEGVYEHQKTCIAKKRNDDLEKYISMQKTTFNRLIAEIINVCDPSYRRAESTQEYVEGEYNTENYGLDFEHDKFEFNPECVISLLNNFYEGLYEYIKDTYCNIKKMHQMVIYISPIETHSYVDYFIKSQKGFSFITEQRCFATILDKIILIFHHYPYILINKGLLTYDEYYKVLKDLTSERINIMDDVYFNKVFKTRKFYNNVIELLKENYNIIGKRYHEYHCKTKEEIMKIVKKAAGEDTMTDKEYDFAIKEITEAYKKVRDIADTSLTKPYTQDFEPCP